MRSRERGAALLETALVLPILLAALYGVTWGVRVGAVSERAESAVRYAGVLSAQQSPYYDYSFYALYNNIGSTALVQPQACQTPPSLLITGGSMPVVPGTPAKTNVTPTFWQPDATSLRSSCLPESGRHTVSGADLSRPFLMLMSSPNMSASVSDAIVGDYEVLSSSVATSSRFYRSPDLATLMHCQAMLSDPVSVSLSPKADPRLPGPTAALTDADLTLSPVAASANCAAAPGAQATLPPSAPYTPPTGSPVPPASPEPPPSPTPTPAASATPASSPTPKVTPTAGATPTPAGGGGAGGGGGGGGSGGTPTPTPSPGGGGGGGGGTPTGTPGTPGPTGTPRTPAPSVPPSTPKPVVTPQPTQPPTPTPRPTQNGTTS